MNKYAEWENGNKRRYILDPDHVPELEREAAVHEFVNKVPRLEAEERAYTEYKRKHHASAAAHHLTGMRAASASGAYGEAKRHKLVYDLHLKAMGYDPTSHQVPDEIQHLLQDPDRKPGVKFKAHNADSFLTFKNEDGIRGAEDLSKMEPAIPQVSISNVLGAPPKEETMHLYRGMRPDYLKATYDRMGALLNSPRAARNPALHDHLRALHHLLNPPMGKAESKPINYHNPKSIEKEFGQQAVPPNFNPQDASHWGKFIAGLSPADRHHVASTLFDHDYAREEKGKNWTRLSDIRSRARKMRKDEMGGSTEAIPSSSIGMWMKEAWSQTPPEVKKAVQEEFSKAAGISGRAPPRPKASNYGAIKAAMIKPEPKPEETKPEEPKEPVKKEEADPRAGGFQAYSTEPYKKPKSPEERSAGAKAAIEAIVRGMRAGKEAKKAEKPYTGRDEGIRRSKLPPGAPEADKAGVGVHEDKKKKADKEAARKWRPGEEE